MHPAARAVIKLALLASFFILIRIAMTYSDNGRLIGKVLCAASVLGVFCLDVQGGIHFSSRREKKLTYLCTVMLAFYLQRFPVFLTGRGRHRSAFPASSTTYGAWLACMGRFALSFRWHL